MTDSTFTEEIEKAIVLYEAEIDRAATRTRAMIERYGEVEALSRLVVSSDLQKGFKALRDSDQLGITFEALVVRFAEKFPREVVQAAQWRLDNPYELL